MSDDKHTLPARIEPEAARLERLNDGGLEAGSYWRALADVPARRFGDGEFLHDDIPRGTVLLLIEIRRAHGADHTAILDAHPSGTPGRSAHLVTEFLRLFEPLTADEALALRRAEIEATQREIGTLQEELLAGPGDVVPDSADLTTAGDEASARVEGSAAPSSVGAVPPPANGVEAAGPGGLPVAGEIREAAELRAEAERAVALARVRADWIARRADRLGRATATLAAYYKEQASLAKAKLSESIAYAKHLDRGVKTLGFYTGEGVEVLTLCQGEAAPPDEPLVLFQGKRFLDEELLIHLHSGGADFRDFEALKAALAEGPLLDRLLPAPRSVAACAWRRRDKVYTHGHAGMAMADAIVASLEAAEMNAANKESFLLVRNGRNVHMVICEAMELAGAARLLPTADEAERPFRGWDGERIGVDDIRFTKAASEAEAMQVRYKRLLVLLWGLDHRLSLFGDFYDRARFPSFLKFDFQEKHFRFVHDDERLLGTGRPDWRSWMEAKNAALQSGSRVLCQWGRLIRPHTAGGCFVRHDYGRKAWQKFEAAERFGLRTARRVGANLAVDVEVRERGNPENKRTVKVLLDADRWDALEGMEVRHPAFLVLDDVDPDDIRFYLDSRVDRADYLSFVPLLAEARDRLAAERPAIEAVCRALDNALVEARFEAQFGDDDRARLVRDAVRAWRAEARGALPPDPGTAGWSKARREILDAIWRRAHATASVGEAAAAAAGAGLEPLRLACDGRGNPILYAAPPPERQETRTGQHAWVERLALLPKNGRFEVTKAESVVLPGHLATEAVLHEWDAASDWVARLAPAGLTLSQARHVADEVARWREVWQSFCGEAWVELLAFADNWRRSHRQDGLVHFPDLCVPFAIAWNGVVAPEWGRDRSRPRVYVMGFGARVDAFLWAIGTPERRREVEEMVRGVYRMGELQVERLREAGASGLSLWSAPVSPDVVTPDAPLWRTLPKAFHPKSFPKAERGRTSPAARLEDAVLATAKENWRYDREKGEPLPYGIWAPDGTFAEVGELLKHAMKDGGR